MPSEIYNQSLSNISKSHLRVEQCKQRLLNLNNPDFSVRVKAINEVIAKLELSKSEYEQSIQEIDNFYNRGGFEGKIQQIKDWWSGSPTSEAKQDVDYIVGQMKLLSAQKNESEKEFWKEHFSSMTPEQIHTKVKEIEGIVRHLESAEEPIPPLQYHHVSLLDLHERLGKVQREISEGLKALQSEPVKRASLQTSEKHLNDMADKSKVLAEKVMGLSKKINP